MHFINLLAKLSFLVHEPGKRLLLLCLYLLIILQLRSLVTQLKQPR